MRFNLFIVFLFTCKLRASKRSMAIRAGRWDLPAEPEGSGGGGGGGGPNGQEIREGERKLRFPE